MVEGVATASKQTDTPVSTAKIGKVKEKYTGFLRINLLEHPKIMADPSYETQAVFYDEENVLLPEDLVLSNITILSRIRHLLTLVKVFKANEDKALEKGLLELKALEENIRENIIAENEKSAVQD